MKLIEENMERLGLLSIQVEVNDGLNDLPTYHESANVLLDAPCSGLGIIRKKPEIKYTKDPEELAELVKIQRGLLETAAAYVPSGGILLYSTCTLNKKENEENIRWFLDNHPEFIPLPRRVGRTGSFPVYGRRISHYSAREDHGRFFHQQSKKKINIHDFCRCCKWLMQKSFFKY